MIKVPVSAIVPNRFQPRKVFNADNIAELASTIEQHGLLQPIILREYEDQKYEIIAGERRFRAIQTSNGLNYQRLFKLWTITKQLQWP